MWLFLYTQKQPQLFTNGRRQTKPSCMCSSVVASPCDSSC